MPKILPPFTKWPRTLSIRKDGVPIPEQEVRTLLASQINYVPKTGCWEWTGTLDVHGYGLTDFDTGNDTGRRHCNRVYRLTYSLYRGGVPRGMHICHHCDNKRCCNPTHLFLGSRSDNRYDIIAKGRSGYPQINHANYPEACVLPPYCVYPLSPGVKWQLDTMTGLVYYKQRRRSFLVPIVKQCNN